MSQTNQAPANVNQTTLVLRRSNGKIIVGRRDWDAPPLPGEIEGISGDVSLASYQKMTAAAHALEEDEARNGPIDQPQHGGHNRGQLSAKAQGRGPVYEVRQAAGLTQAAFAQALGCGPTAIHGYERDGVLPTNQRILNAFLQFANDNGLDFTAII